MDKTADVLVIGAGIIGNAAAYYLAKEGLRVTVLEKSGIIGDGGSSRNGGGVRQSARDVRELPLALYAVEHLWPTLGEELGFDVEYRKKGNLRLANDEAGMQRLRALADASRKAGLSVDVIGADDVHQICPYFSEKVIGASWCPTVFEYEPQAQSSGDMLYLTSHSVFQFIPILANVKVVRTWGGWMDLTVDGVPIIDAPEETPGLILACGFSGHGFGIAPAVGLTVSEMVLGKEPTISLPGLVYSRFENWN